MSMMSASHSYAPVGTLVSPIEGLKLLDAVNLQMASFVGTLVSPIERVGTILPVESERES